jgi:hypothetical protein
LNKGTTIDNVRVGDSVRARPLALVDFTAILGNLFSSLKLYRTGAALSRPGLPGHVLPC